MAAAPQPQTDRQPRQADQERAWVRELARRVAAIATSDENARICQRWRDVNALRQPDRAPVWCRPVGCWSEILPLDALRCEDPWLRGIEYGFRQILHKHDIGDDTPVEGVMPVPAVFDVEPANVWGMDIARHRPDEADGAWAYDAPLKEDEDFDRLRLPTFTYNHGETQERLSRMHELLGDTLPVERVCAPPLSATLGQIAANLRGLTDFMMDMAATPERVHRLMGHLRNGVLKAMDEIEATGLLTPNNTGAMTLSDPVGPSTEDGRVTYANCWCMLNSQEFDPVSPAMWETFCLDYQRPIMERFGWVGYGCCENLTHKIAGVLSIPNLRIFTCSAWTDLQAVLEALGTEYVIMWRQKATDVVFPDDTRTLRRDLEDGTRALRGSFYQIVLRELQTLRGHADRLHVWTACAKEEAAKYA